VGGPGRQVAISGGGAPGGGTKSWTCSLFALPPHHRTRCRFPTHQPAPDSLYLSGDWEEQPSSAALTDRLEARATDVEEEIGGRVPVYVVVASRSVLFVSDGNTAGLADARERERAVGFFVVV
jgi:hypothetical protein